MEFEYLHDFENQHLFDRFQLQNPCHHIEDSSRDDWHGLVVDIELDDDSDDDGDHRGPRVVQMDMVQHHWDVNIVVVVAGVRGVDVGAEVVDNDVGSGAAVPGAAVVGVVGVEVLGVEVADAGMSGVEVAAAGMELVEE